MSDPAVARLIAEWYKQLHSQGYGYVCQHGESMYDEADFFTLENIACIKEKTGTQDAPAWVLLEQNYAAINDLLRKARRTITYNDFYYTNMVVAKDNSSALMFDYNLLGKGYAYTDVRNVISSLSENLSAIRESISSRLFSSKSEIISYATSSTAWTEPEQVSRTILYTPSLY